jgi:hypothetical protein
MNKIFPLKFKPISYWCERKSRRNRLAQLKKDDGSCKDEDPKTIAARINPHAIVGPGLIFCVILGVKTLRVCN